MGHWFGFGNLSCLLTLRLAFSSYLRSFEHLQREARDENGIRKPKSALHKMQSAVQYFMTKLRGLHKKSRFHSLKSAFTRSGETDYDWYRGYYVFPSKDEILRRFNSGEPLSCFVLDNNYQRMHVAYNAEGNLRGSGNMSYITFGYSTSTLHVKEIGVHFCKFSVHEDTSVARKQNLNITDFALMLPLLKPREGGSLFQKQFTLVYWDWNVLRCDLPEKKGTASTKNKLFAEIDGDL